MAVLTLSHFAKFIMGVKEWFCQDGLRCHQASTIPHAGRPEAAPRPEGRPQRAKPTIPEVHCRLIRERERQRSYPASRTTRTSGLGRCPPARPPRVLRRA